MILGVALYDIFNWFYVYSFLGWLFESTYVSIVHKKVVNRGFMSGPFCTIYGFGALIVYLLLYPVEESVLYLFLGGCLLTTALEYLTGVIMELLFHTNWWDYSNKKIQFQGKICLSSSLAWGSFSVLLFKIIHPFVNFVTHLYSVRTGVILLVIVTILSIGDFCLSLVYALKLDQKLKNMNQLIDDFYNFLLKSRLADTKDELIGKLSSIKSIDILRADFKCRIENIADSITEHIKDAKSDDKKPEIVKKLMETAEKYINLGSKINFIHKRFINAYPNLKSRFQARQNQLKVLKDKIKRNR